MTHPYRCNKCHKLLTRDYGKRTWVQSYCVKMDVMARLYRVKKNKNSR